MKRNAIVLAFSVLAFAGVSACGMLGERDDTAAGGSSAQGTKESFTSLDKDNDGMLSRTEAAADKDAQSDFDKLDTNKDQRLSRSEYEARGSASGATRGSTGGSKY